MLASALPGLHSIDPSQACRASGSPGCSASSARGVPAVAHTANCVHWLGPQLHTSPLWPAKAAGQHSCFLAPTALHGLCPSTGTHRQRSAGFAFAFHSGISCLAAFSGIRSPRHVRSHSPQKADGQIETSRTGHLDDGEKRMRVTSESWQLAEASPGKLPVSASLACPVCGTAHPKVTVSNAETLCRCLGQMLAFR